MVFVCKAWGILAPLPGIKPASPALEGKVLTTGQPGKSPGEHLSLMESKGTGPWGAAVLASGLGKEICSLPLTASSCTFLPSLVPFWSLSREAGLVSREGSLRMTHTFPIWPLVGGGGKGEDVPASLGSASHPTSTRSLVSPKEARDTAIRSETPSKCFSPPSLSGNCHSVSRKAPRVFSHLLLYF